MCAAMLLQTVGHGTRCKSEAKSSSNIVKSQQIMSKEMSKEVMSK